MINNRDQIYEREAMTHDDEHFDVRRNETVSIYYRKPAFNDVINCAYNFMGNINGKKLLEFGCGNGDNIEYFVSAGAFYTGFDISVLRINRAIKLINKLQLNDKAQVSVLNAEKIDFPDNSFDIVYAQAIIHHLDIDTALKDIKRILKPGGFAVFVEPRGNNPIINYFRNRSPSIRTIDEHPLVIEDFLLFEKYFTVKQKNFYMFSLVSFLFRKYLKSEFIFTLSKSLFDAIDKIFFKVFPFSRRFAWYCVVKLS